MDTRLVRYLVTNAAIGMGLGWCIAALIFLFDVFGLSSLAMNTSVGWVAVAMVFFIFGTSFGSMQMGIAVMALSETPGSVPGGLHRFFSRMAVMKSLGTRDVGTTRRDATPAV